MNPQDQNNSSAPQPNEPVPQNSAAAAEQPQAVRYIAVDANGNPLPQQPPAGFQPPSPAAPVGATPQMVYMTRPMVPAHMQISPEMKRRHEESKKKYPFLNLSEGEYVISHVVRHPIGLISIWALVGTLVTIMLGVLVAFGAFGSSVAASIGIQGDLPSLGVFSLPILLLIFMFLLGGYISSIVYAGNKFFLTNESVIQELQLSLFVKREQTVSLENIEDASFSQTGIIQTMLNYGSIRLSTEGDETTYKFSYVADPKKQVAILNDAVEAFKNGRPFEV